MLEFKKLFFPVSRTPLLVLDPEMRTSRGATLHCSSSSKFRTNSGPLEVWPAGQDHLGRQKTPQGTVLQYISYTLATIAAHAHNMAHAGTMCGRILNFITAVIIESIFVKDTVLNFKNLVWACIRLYEYENVHPVKTLRVNQIGWLISRK